MFAPEDTEVLLPKKLSHFTRKNRYGESEKMKAIANSPLSRDRS